VLLRQLSARVAHLLQVVHTNNTVREASCRHIKSVNSATRWELLWVSVMLRGETHFYRDAYVYAHRKRQKRLSCGQVFVMKYLRGAWCLGLLSKL
jgi:hypothetical protein